MQHEASQVNADLLYTGPGHAVSVDQRGVSRADRSYAYSPFYVLSKLCCADKRRIHTRAVSGRLGNSVNASGGASSASATALARAAPTPVVPPSPHPFTPSGLWREGASSVIITSISGASQEVGSK